MIINIWVPVLIPGKYSPNYILPSLETNRPAVCLSQKLACSCLRHMELRVPFKTVAFLLGLSVEVQCYSRFCCCAMFQRARWWRSTFHVDLSLSLREGGVAGYSLEERTRKRRRASGLQNGAPIASGEGEASMRILSFVLMNLFLLASTLWECQLRYSQLQ